MIPKDIRLIVVDIDGTIAGISNTVTQPVRQALQQAQAKGIHVGIATGRMYRSALRFHQAIGADMPLSAYQGALIKHPQDGKVYQHWSLDQHMARELMQVLADYPLIVHLYIDDELYVREMNSLSVGYAERSQVPLHLLSDLGPELNVDPTKLLAMTEDTSLIIDLLAKMRRRFSPEQLYLTRSQPTFLEATNPLVNKGNAVRYLAETILGLGREQVMTIGDSDNDIEMLEYAGVGVAMGNANDLVKGHADWIAPSVEQDGVVAALQNFVL